MAHVMHDLETMGKIPGVVLASLGAVAFEPTESTLGETFSMNIDEASCLAAGLVLDPETVAWWRDPERAEAYAALKVDPRPLADVLDAFDAFYRRNSPPPEEKADRFWSNGPSFDETILGAAYRALGRNTPWRYNAGRDCRTIYDLAGLQLKHTEGTFHVAVDDAIEQAKLVQQAYQDLYLTPISWTRSQRIGSTNDAVAELIKRGRAAAGDRGGWRLLIIDLATGARVDHVTEVDVNEGWVIRTVVDESGRRQTDPATGVLVTERIEGRFELRDARPAEPRSDV